MIEQAGGQSLAVSCDVTRADDIKAALDAAVERFGRLDIAFNNAGIEQPIKPAAEITDDEWDRLGTANRPDADSYRCVSSSWRFWSAGSGRPRFSSRSYCPAPLPPAPDRGRATAATASAPDAAPRTPGYEFPPRGPEPNRASRLAPPQPPEEPSQLLARPERDRPQHHAAVGSDLGDELDLRHGPSVAAEHEADIKIAYEPYVPRRRLRVLRQGTAVRSPGTVHGIVLLLPRCGSERRACPDACLSSDPITRRVRAATPALTTDRK